MEQPPEEFEHLPWSELSAAHQSGRSRTIYLAAAALVVLALGAVVARSLVRPAPAAVVDPSPVAAEQPEPSATTVAPPPSVAPTVIVPPAPSLFSEADLMAALPASDGMRAAVARAEWFVVDYFTADLDPLASEPIVAALPAGAAVPGLPQDRAAPPISFVEWARATDAREVAPAEFVVTVAYRTIGSTEDGGFIRLPVRAVEVTVVAGSDGGSTVADLPAPAEFIPGPLVEPWPDAAAELPDAVVGAALQHAARWGPYPQLVEGGLDGAAWRIVVSVEDEVGNRWPLVMRFDETGTRLDS